MYVDTEVAAVEEYERGEVDKMLASTKPAGGGGTAFQCVSDYLKKNQMQPTVIVFFTDGYTCSWPEDLGIPTVWLIYQNDSCQPPHGSVAYV
jgi:predicted metal-dependent peptidase